MNYLIGDIGNTSLKICKINNKFRIVKTFFFRTRSVYLEKDLKKTINQFTKSIFENEKLEVFDSNTWRPYCHVYDFARLIEKVLLTEKKKIYFQEFI